MEERALNARLPSKSKLAYVVQVADGFEEDMYQMKWRTIVEDAQILQDDSTVTQTECTAAVEEARTICCLARTGCICFDLDVNLIEDYNKNKTRKRDEVEEDFEGRWKWKG